MELFLPMTPETACEFFRNRIMTHPMSKHVNIWLTDSKLEVRITKIGTTKLTFSFKVSPEGTTFKKISESISFIHRPYVSDIHKLIADVIKEQGGWVR